MRLKCKSSELVSASTTYKKPVWVCANICHAGNFNRAKHFPDANAKRAEVAINLIKTLKRMLWRRNGGFKNRE